MAKYIDENGFAHFLGKLKTLLDGKVSTESGKGLSTNDYTTAEKNKLAGIETGAQVNTVTGIKGNSESSYRTGQVNITAANVGAAASSHTHGNIQNGGTLQTTDVAIANGDKLVITDSSDSSKVARASIAFDGSTVTQALTKKGTWETFNNYSLPTASDQVKGGVKIGAGLTMTGEVLSADVQSVPVMTGATSSAAGTAGIVPSQPANTPGYYVLTSSGQWGKFILATASKNGAVGISYEIETADGQDITPAGNTVGLFAPIDPATTYMPGLMSAADKSKLDAFGAASTYALKSDITSMYKHKGSVSSAANLPFENVSAGDVYNLASTGMNYVALFDTANPMATLDVSAQTLAGSGPLANEPEYTVVKGINTNGNGAADYVILINNVYTVFTASNAFSLGAWDALGEIFTINSMTTTEIDAAFVTAGLTAA